jgi:hypothetical protein
MARFKRARRAYSRAKKHYRRHKSFKGGMMNDVIAGAVVGGIAAIASPYINSNVPSVFQGVSPTAEVLTVAGAAGKFMHKGGRWADAALIIGVGNIVAGAIADISGGVGAGAENVY